MLIYLLTGVVVLRREHPRDSAGLEAEIRKLVHGYVASALAER